MADSKYAQSLIRTINDFPSPGIIFKDVTPMLKDARAFHEVVSAIAEVGQDADLIAGIEARGFILASAVAATMKKGFVPIRKKGKLPYRTYSESYGLEYGIDELEIHEDAVTKGERVLLIDDVLATGGTLRAATNLVQRTGGVVIGAAVLMEIAGLNGRKIFTDAFPGVSLTTLFL
jgi:adenine phosphoribosyltransferase